MADRAAHWNRVYTERDEAALTWFEADPTLSLALVAAYATPDAAVLDVGGGASRLAEALLARGYRDITVLDLSDRALAVNRARMGAAADRLRWIAGDVTDWPDPPQVDLWHDRAVFHFLTAEADQKAYLDTLSRALKSGGHAIIATFAEDGPPTCSGLPVARYSPATLAARVAALAPGLLTPVEARAHVHLTPKGNRQSFQTSVFRRD